MVEEGNQVLSKKAAEFLQISRLYLAKLLDGDESTLHLRGTHCRVRTSNLIDDKQAREITSKQALQKMVEVTEGMGLYDE